MGPKVSPAFLMIELNRVSLPSMPVRAPEGADPIAKIQSALSMPPSQGVTEALAQIRSLAANYSKGKA